MSIHRAPDVNGLALREQLEKELAQVAVVFVSGLTITCGSCRRGSKILLRLLLLKIGGCGLRLRVGDCGNRKRCPQEHGKRTEQ
jgi:hypothetical protein